MIYTFVLFPLWQVSLFHLSPQHAIYMAWFKISVHQSLKLVGFFFGFRVSPDHILLLYVNPKLVLQFWSVVGAYYIRQPCVGQIFGCTWVPYFWVKSRFLIIPQYYRKIMTTLIANCLAHRPPQKWDNTCCIGTIQ